MGIWFSKEGAPVVVDIHTNTFDTNTKDFELVADAMNWTVDASENFFAAPPPVVSDAGSGNTLTLNPLLDSDQYIAECLPPTAVIPTLSEWGLIAMAGFLGIVGLFAIRRKKAAVSI